MHLKKAPHTPFKRKKNKTREKIFFPVPNYNRNKYNIKVNTTNQITTKNLPKTKNQHKFKKNSKITNKEDFSEVGSSTSVNSTTKLVGTSTTKVGSST